MHRSQAGPSHIDLPSSSQSQMSNSSPASANVTADRPPTPYSASSALPPTQSECEPQAQHVALEPINESAESDEPAPSQPGQSFHSTVSNRLVIPTPALHGARAPALSPIPASPLDAPPGYFPPSGPSSSRAPPQATPPSAPTASAPPAAPQHQQTAAPDPPSGPEQAMSWVRRVFGNPDNDPRPDPSASSTTSAKASSSTRPIGTPAPSDHCSPSAGSRSAPRPSSNPRPASQPSAPRSFPAITLMPVLGYKYTRENSSWQAPPVKGPCVRRKKVKPAARGATAVIVRSGTTVEAGRVAHVRSESFEREERKAWRDIKIALRAVHL